MPSNSVFESVLDNSVLSSAFIKMLDPPKEILHFVTTPKIVGDSVTAQYRNTPIPRSTQPRLFWLHTTGRIVTVQTDFYATTNPRVEVLNKVNWCRALQYPIASGLVNLLSRPPIVLLVIGKLISMRAIVTQVTPDWHMDNGIDVNLIPLRVGMSIQFEQLKENPAKAYSFSDIAQGRA